jgi:thiamine biosynthesis lipoprotein
VGRAIVRLGHRAGRACRSGAALFAAALASAALSMQPAGAASFPSAGASAAALPLLLALSYEPTVATVERRVETMGTMLEMTVRARYRESALAASEAALAEIQRVEALLTTWRPGGELAAVDAAPAGRKTAVSAELAGLLAEVFAWSPRTQGAFDPAVLPLVRAWDLRGNGRIPTPAELSAARRASGIDRFRVDLPGRSVTRLAAEAGIDEGAWGKGYALDRAARVLREARIESALLNLGGEVLAFGDDRSEQPWRVPVAHPRDRRRTVLELGLSRLAAATSGDSERGREVAGRRIGHVLDPRTGEPSPDFGSVTVVAPSALDADILSTAFFVLGPEAGLALSARLRREGVDNQVLFLVDRGGMLEAVASPGLSPLVLASDPRAVHGLASNPD